MKEEKDTACKKVSDDCEKKKKDLAERIKLCDGAAYTTVVDPNEGKNLAIKGIDTTAITGGTPRVRISNLSRDGIITLKFN